MTSLTKPGFQFKRQWRLTSGVWVNFEFLDEPDENGNLVCKCKKCEYEMELSIFKDKFHSLYEAYSTEYAAALPSSSSSQNRKNKSAQQDVVDIDVSTDEFMTDFDDFSSEKSSVHNKTDSAMYLEEPLVPRTTNIDILYHWKTNERRFPVLSFMARDVLAIPISTVASELAFSTSGRVLDCYRSTLKPSTVEAIICLKDWTFGEAKMDPQLEDLCGKVMSLKVNEDTPSPQESAQPSPVESAMEGGSEV